MNAADYLSKQGWRGEGFSLDTSDRGLAKPLLISKKLNLGGVGKKEHQDFNDQWWLNAWDKKPATAQATSIPSSATHHLFRRPGLYANFVQGQTLESTIELRPDSDDTSTISSNDPASTHTAMSDPAIKKSKDKKRKRSEESTALQNGDGVKTNKKPKTQAPAEDELSHDSEEPAPKVDSALGREKKEKVKKLPREIREERKEAKLAAAKENAIRNRKQEAEIIARLQKEQGLDDGETSSSSSEDSDDGSDAEDSDSDDDSDSAPLQEEEPHKDSIYALREAGQKVLHPLLPDLPRDSKDPWYRAYELARKAAMKEGRSKLVLPDMEKWVAANGVPDVSGEQAKKSYKGDKYDRERLKRIAKREYRHWGVAFRETKKYRPDGLPVTGEDVDIEHGNKKEKKKKKKTVAERNAKKDRPTPEERKARRAAKDERREKMRAIKKVARAERKLRNQEKAVAQRKAQQAKKREKEIRAEQVLAAEQGISYEEFVQRRLTETLAQKESKASKKKAKAEANATLAIARQQRLEQDTADLAVATTSLANGKALTLKQAPPKRQGGSARKGSDFISLDAGASDDEQDEWEDIAETATTKLPKVGKKNKEANSSGEPAPALGFVIDTEGDRTLGASSSNAPAISDANGATSVKVPKNIKVREMTKEQRKARLEQMRARRAERKAAAGKNPSSKKDSKKTRAQRKEDMINKLTTEILTKKRKLPPNPDAPEVKAMSKKEKKAQPEAGKGWTRDDWNSAKREARRFQRAVKAGKVPENEVPLGWTGTIRKEPKRKGNGGREPLRPFWHEWTMGGERIDLRDGNKK